jgi:hypothetical protein
MELTQAQRYELMERGYLRIPGLIPRERVNAALRAINGSLGERGMGPDDLPSLRARSYCPELQYDPVISDLFDATPFRSLAESVIGVGRLATPVGRGQIALRFPGPGPAATARPHIDGVYSPTNGVPKGEIRNFTALGGVMLSDLPEGSGGNLTIWPGSHLLNAAWFRDRGPKSLLDGVPQIDWPEPVEVRGEAGDAILAHYLLGHGISGHSGPNIRYAIYFRLQHVDHERMKWESMVDPWLEWEGMGRSLVEAKP